MKYLLLLITTLLLSGFFLFEKRNIDRENLQVEEQVYLQVDKTFYKPGEDIWFSAWIIDREQQTLTNLSEIVYVELINPKGKVEKTHKLLVKEGRANGDFHLSDEIAGGLYKIRAYTLWMKNIGEDNYFEKELTVQKVVLPNLLMELKFLEKGYGAGDEATAELDLKNLENEALIDKKFEYEVFIDGQKIKKKSVRTDEEGKALIKFKLPNKLISPDGVLNIILEHQGKIESISRTVPITLKNIELSFFPEGGNFIHSVNSRVAFKAIDKYGKPTDVEGKILDENGAVITTFKSFHDGMGAFRITPHVGEKYIARIDKPNTLKSTYVLPEIENEGYSLELNRDEYHNLQTEIRSTQRSKVTLVAKIKGKTYFKKRLKIINGLNIYDIPTGNMPAGILKVTVLDKDDIEQCERLVFVNKTKLMNIEIKADKEKYLPREKVTLDIKTTDNSGKVISADIALSVVNNNLLSFSDDKQDHILSSLLLSQEVKGKINEPQFYFKKDEPKADKALDYLLMTQGWRKFIWKDSTELLYMAEKAQVIGRLVDYEGRPFKNHKVWIVETKDSVFTDADGYFVFKNIVIDRRLTIRALDAKGYKTDYYINNYINYFVTSDYVKGTVINIKHEPVANAKISYPGTTITAITNSRGNFQIAKIRNRNILHIEGDLYKNKQIKINNPDKLQIVNLDYKDPRYGCSPEKTIQYEKVLIQKGKKIYDKENLEKSVVLKKIKQGQKSKANGKQLIPPGNQVVEILNIVDDEVEINEELVFNTCEDMENTEVIFIPELVEQEEEDEEQIFMFASKMPEFTGGELGLRSFIAKNVKYPVQARESCVEGKVYVRFVVTSNGEVEKVSIARGVDPILDQEAIRVVKSLPKWKPGMRGGRQVNVWYTVPINFNLVNSDGSKPKGYYAGLQISGPNYQTDGQNSVYRARKFYVPKYDSEEKIDKRTDFRSTIYWNPQIITDEKGQAQVSFYNSDEITSFKALAEGISSNGMVGRGEQIYFTQLPFSINAKLPQFLTFGDNLQVPVTLSNNTDKNITGKLDLVKMQALQLNNESFSKQLIKAKTSKTLWLEFTVLNTEGKQIFDLSFKSEGLSDAVKKEIMVLPKGFPVNLVFSSNDLESKFNFEIGEMVPGSLQARFKAFPSILNDLMGGIESILREPYGCFEQTSSSTYPNLLVLDYMKSTGNITASIRKKAMKLTDKGYKRLIGFETKEKGYEWFGRTPAHEGLTAYGLMEFSDMAKVYKGVDSEMVRRTQDWLLGKRDGKGNFSKRDGLRNFHGLSYELQNAYIVYALSESGYYDIGIEYLKAYENATKSNDAYLMTLLANTAFNIDKDNEGVKLLSFIDKQIDKFGFGKLNAKESIVRSRRHSLQVETASLYLLALLKSTNPSIVKIDEAVRYIAGSRKSYAGFGSTQATILALKALTSYAKTNKSSRADGAIHLMVNNKFSKQTGYSASQSKPIEINNLHSYLKTGNNKVKVNIKSAKKAIPYSFSIQYNASVPVSSKECILKLVTKLNHNKVKMGDLVKMDVTIKNIAEEHTPMAIAKIGIPSGLSLQPYQLKELLEKKMVDYYEIFDNYLVFYFTSLKPGQEVSIPLDLKTELPGSYEAPASSVYLYYTNEFKHWVAGEKIEIKK